MNTDNDQENDGEAIEVEPVEKIDAAEDVTSIKVDTSLDSSKSNTVNIVYILYLVSIVVGITAIIGLVIAYVNRSSAPEWLQSHYTYQIRTFWIGMLYCLIGMILTFVLVGFVVFLIGFVWYVVRCIKGLQTIGRQAPIENPKTWWI